MIFVGLHGGRWTAWDIWILRPSVATNTPPSTTTVVGRLSSRIRRVSIRRLV